MNFFGLVTALLAVLLLLLLFLVAIHTFFLQPRSKDQRKKNAKKGGGWKKVQALCCEHKERGKYPRHDTTRPGFPRSFHSPRRCCCSHPESFFFFFLLVLSERRVNKKGGKVELKILQYGVCERVEMVGRWDMVWYDTQVLTGKEEEYSCGNSIAVHARHCSCRSDHSCKTYEA